MATTTLRAPISWLRAIVNNLDLSAEVTRDTSETVSFLSCVKISIEDECATFETESAHSTAFATTAYNDEVEVEGEGVYLVRSKDLVSFVGSMPSDGEVVIDFDDDLSSYSVVYGDSEIRFDAQLETITSPDALPRAMWGFPEGVKVVEVESAELTAAYRLGASMAKPEDKEITTGYDFYSGAYVNLAEGEVSVLSGASGSAEAMIKSRKAQDVVIDDELNLEQEYPISLVTLPSVTTPRIAAVAGESVNVQLAIVDDHLHLGTDTGLHVAIAKMEAVMGKETDYERILRVMNPFWKRREVTMQISAKKLKEALSRAGKVGADAVSLEISSSYCKVVGKGIYEVLARPFSQRIACTTQWHSDEEKFLEVPVRRDLLAKFFTLSPIDDTYTIDVCLGDRVGKAVPQVVVVHTGERFDPERPHDFFVCPTVLLG